MVKRKRPDPFKNIPVIWDLKSKRNSAYRTYIKNASKMTMEEVSNHITQLVETDKKRDKDGEA
jgi:hypothetical protein